MTPEGEQRVVALLERILAALERANAPKPAWVNQAEVAALVGVHVRTLRRLRKEPSFPKPVTTGRMLRWRRDEVERFLLRKST